MIEQYRTAARMARALCSYIPDDERVRAEIAATFKESVSVDTVRRIRANRRRQIASFRQNAEEWCFDTPDPMHNSEYADRAKDMEKASRKLLAALWDKHQRVMLVHRAHGRQVVDV